MTRHVQPRILIYYIIENVWHKSKHELQKHIQNITSRQLLETAIRNIWTGVYDKALDKWIYFLLYCYIVTQIGNPRCSSFEVGSHFEIIFTFGIMLYQSTASSRTFKKRLGIHHIRAKLYSLTLSKINSQYTTQVLIPFLLCTIWLPL